ncbi:MAG: urease accessory protein UreE [Limnothrix sp. RL_2_0]|nr:urease accessory protein UreE [Limnothrix sp. RL_2_0]
MTKPIVFTKKCPKDAFPKADLFIELAADQRQKVKQRIELDDSKIVHFDLPRGTHIHINDFFQTADAALTAQVKPKAESTITVKSQDPLLLMKAAYHLGNRHVPLEVQAAYLRFAPDYVLEEMLKKIGLELTPETVPFFPEQGAYGGHSHNH